MVGDNPSIQVLNISNVNAQGKTVLNDGKLLELIQKYPFLYNPRVRAYNDSDYETWAWKNINASFNRSYANDPNAAFSIDDLRTRWHCLKPLIQCLSKAYDMDAIPQYLRNSVVKICTELEDQSCNVMTKPNNSAQNLLLQNMSAIAELPMEKKLALERDILDVILSSELQNKHVTKLDDNDWKEIYKDTEELLNDIGFKQLLSASANHRQKIFYNNSSNQYSKRSHMKSLGWVPLKEVYKIVKPCRVKVNRINIEDYLPLAQIIQMSKMKTVKTTTASPHRESPGIFGL